MKYFKCLSRNASILSDAGDTSQARLPLNFKNKKRRFAAKKRYAPRWATPRSYTVLSAHDENMPPSILKKKPSPSRQLATPARWTGNVRRSVHFDIFSPEVRNFENESATDCPTESQIHTSPQESPNEEAQIAANSLVQNSTNLSEASSVLSETQENLPLLDKSNVSCKSVDQSALFPPEFFQPVSQTTRTLTQLHCHINKWLSTLESADEPDFKMPTFSSLPDIRETTKEENACPKDFSPAGESSRKETGPTSRSALCSPYNATRLENFRKHVVKTKDPCDAADDDYDNSGGFSAPCSFSAGERCNDKEEKKNCDQICNKRKNVEISPDNQNTAKEMKTDKSLEQIEISVVRGKQGFGFSFIGECPPIIGQVKPGSPADEAGIKNGDLVIEINGYDMSRSSCESAALLVMKRRMTLIMFVLLRNCTRTTNESTRDSQQSDDTSPDYTLESCIATDDTSPDYTLESCIATEDLFDSSCDEYSEDTLHNTAYSEVYDDKEEEEEEEDDDDESFIEGSTAVFSETFTIEESVVEPQDKCSDTLNAQLKSEYIQRLMSLEEEYIKFMHYGIERYSRPLRFCIITGHQHLTLFQNVEKIVTISEYHNKHMKDDIYPDSELDDSQFSKSGLLLHSPAITYQSKVRMLCQSYETYADGLELANTLLQKMRKNGKFRDYLKELESNGLSNTQPTIEAFINRPVQHIQNLHAAMNDILSATPSHSTDFDVLQQIVARLFKCAKRVKQLRHDSRMHTQNLFTHHHGVRKTDQLVTL